MSVLDAIVLGTVYTVHGWAFGHFSTLVAPFPCYMCGNYKQKTTSDAHSCNVPTTGINIPSCDDLRSLANIGIAPARRMACLFFVDLLQLHNARAPARATATSLSPEFSGTSRSDTCE